MGRWVGERVDHLEKVQNRARPAMGQDHRQGVRMARPYVDEMDIESVDLGQELRQGIQSGLGIPPVLGRSPVTREVLHRGQPDALGLIADSLTVGPPCRDDAPPEICKILFRNIDAEGTDARTFVCRSRRAKGQVESPCGRRGHRGSRGGKEHAPRVPRGDFGHGRPSWVMRRLSRRDSRRRHTRNCPTAKVEIRQGIPASQGLRRPGGSGRRRWDAWITTGVVTERNVVQHCVKSQLGPRNRRTTCTSAERRAADGGGQGSGGLALRSIDGRTGP
jgi:hypothetical protein